ncbi:MAG: glycosyltransferase family 2 protein, partial [Thermoplasmata archaeon]|nr:glycosyltransferase family 2 protein [Thermoplasmata archaeon]
HISGEIIVLDSSSDQTGAIARNNDAIVIHPVKSGYGNAYLEGFRQAKGKYIVMGDADNTYDFFDIPRFIEPLRNGVVDLVIGSRFKGQITPGSMAPLHRYIGNPVLTMMLNLIFHTKFSDSHSGFRAIRHSSLEKLNLTSGGMEFASEMLIQAARHKLKITEIPITYYSRVSPSKLHSFADGWRHVRFILLMRPIPFLALPGIFFAFIGFALMGIFYLTGDIETSHLHSFILSAFLLLGGVQGVLTGILISTYSTIHGYQERTPFMKRIMNYHSLEKFLIAGGASIFSGIVIGAYIIRTWFTSHFGMLTQISTAIVALLLIIIGMEIIFFSIFTSMMMLNDNYENLREIK